MALTANDLLHDADLFRSVYPFWPRSSPEREPAAVEPAASPAGPSCGHGDNGRPAFCSCPTPAISLARLDALDADWAAEIARVAR